MSRLEVNEQIGFRVRRYSLRQRKPQLPRLTRKLWGAVWREMTPRERAELWIFADAHNVTLWQATEAWWAVNGSSDHKRAVSS